VKDAVVSLGELMSHDLHQAMKGGDKVRVSTLRLLKAAVKNREIAKGATLEDEEVIEVIIAATKQRRETIRFAREHGREDIAEQEEHELAILETYLPKPLDLDEVRQHIDVVVRELGATSSQDVGRVMKILMPTLKGRVDGSLVNRLVRERLA
jgi:uncharacterized protein YqeY